MATEFLGVSAAHAFFIYICILSLITFALMGADKLRAIRKKRRISEKTLFISAILGGGAGGVLGMLIFRHKTKHLSFVIGMPVICAANIVLAWIMLRFVI